MPSAFMLIMAQLGLCNRLACRLAYPYILWCCLGRNCTEGGGMCLTENLIMPGRKFRNEQSQDSISLAN